MTEIRLPLSITYETEIPTSVADVIVALQSADAISKDAVSLLPSLIDGLQVEQCSLNVHSLTEGSLREALFLAMLITYQADLAEEVPPMIEDLFKVTVSEKYDTIATIVFLVVLFYGAGLAVDVARKAFTDSLPRAKLNELIDLLALETGKSSSDVRKIVEARFKKPAAAKRLVNQAKLFFQPSQKDRNSPITFDRDTVESDVVADVPYSAESDKPQDFDRYTPHDGVVLEMHAQDKDKSATGWAAVAPEISEKRLKVRVMDPVVPSDLWGLDQITADIVVVNKLTSEGYSPAEIQLINIISEGEAQTHQSIQVTE